MDRAPVSTDETELRIGAIYRHYKGNFYRVVGLGRHTETNEELVSYVSLNNGGVHEMRHRPPAMFRGRTSDGIPRFTMVAKDFHTWKMEEKKQGRVVTGAATR